MASTADLAGYPPTVWYFSKITDTDHAGYVWILALLTLLYPLGSCFVRFNVRYGLYMNDDWVLGGATLLSLFQHISLFVAIRKGFGKSSEILSADQRQVVDNALYAAQVLFILSHCMAKVSLALTVRRLFNNSRRLNVVLCWTLVGVSIAWGVLTLFILLVECSTLQFSTGAAHCVGEDTRWRIVTALEIITETAIIAVPCVLVSSVLIGSKPKVLVMIAFSTRMPVFAFSIMHMVQVRNSTLASHSGFTYVKPFVWLQIWLAWSVFTASVPSFKAFMNPFDTVNAHHNDSDFRSDRVDNNGQYLMMGRMKPQSNSKSAMNVTARSFGAGMGVMRQDNVETEATISHGHKHRRGSHDAISIKSGSSQEDIIRKDVVWEVTHDPVDTASPVEGSIDLE